MSTASSPALQRLNEIPWEALEGREAPLLAAIAEALSGQPAERVVDRLLRRERSLPAPARHAYAEAVFGCSLWRRRIAHLLGEKEPSALSAEQLLSGLLELAHPQPQPEPENLAIRHSFPDWLFEILQREYPTTAEALADCLNLPGQVCLRANTLRTTREELAALLATEGLATQPGTLAPHSLVVTGARPNIYGLRSFQEGLFEVQDEGSQLLGALVDARPGDSVLDLCAGAGGKTLLLGAQLQNQGELHAYDPDLSRLDRLRIRATRAGLTNLRIHSALPETLKVDRVLIDAPCSELGALRRGPDRRFLIDPSTFTGLPALQRSLLERALLHLREGGLLVYATCTFRREENEEVAQAFHAAHPELTQQGAFLRLAPHTHGTDGFFAAVYRR